jgi:NADH-quinone oxidoreductase subunit N
MPLDLTQGRDLALALLPELILTVWALLMLLYTAWRHKRPNVQRQVGWLSLVGVILAAAATGWLWASDASVPGIATVMAVDSFRWGATMVILIGTALSIIIAMDYLEREGISIPEYHVMVLFAAIGMLLLTGGADLMIVFLGLELMSVSVYVLAAINRRSILSAEAGLKYFLLGAFASAFLLYGIALLYGASGTTRIALLSLGIGSMDGPGRFMLYAGIAMVMIGFSFKVAAVPFHMWAPDVYDGAPTPATAFMAAAVKTAAFAAFARVMLQGLGIAHAEWAQALWYVAAATMIAGNLLALAQRSLKRMLAYSSIAHAGYLMVAVVTGSVAGATALLFYLMFYTLVTVAAFTVLIAKGRGGEREVTVDDLAGLASSDRLLAFVMAVAMLSLLGFPGTAGFIGKWYILASASGTGFASLAAILVVTSVVSAGYYLPVIMAMYMKEPLHATVHADVKLPGAVRGVLAALAMALLLFGVWPNRALEAARDGGLSFRQTRAATIHPVGNAR